MNKRFENFLIRMQKYTKVDNVYFVRGGFWVFSEYVISTLLNIALIVLFANLVSKEVYGGYQFVLAVFGSVSFFSLPGINKAIMQSVSRGYENTFITGVRSRMKWSVLGSLSLLLLAIYLYLFKPSDFVVYFIIAAALFPLANSFDSYEFLFIGKKMFRKRSTYLIVRKIIFIGGTILALVLTRNLLIIFIAYFGLNALTNMILHWRAKRYITNHKTDKKAVKYGKHLSVMYMLGIISSYFDKMVTAYFLGLAELAVYAMAAGVSMQFKTAGQQTVKYLLFPKMSTIRGKEVKNVILKKTMWAFVASVAAIAILYLATPFIIIFFLSSKYAAAIPYTQVLFISLVLIYPTIILRTYLEAKKKVKQLYYFNIIPSIIKMVLLVVLVYFFQLWGAVAAVLIFRYFSFFQILYLFIKS